LKVIQGYRNCLYCIGHKNPFLLVVCSNNDSILHRFRDIATFKVYMTARDDLQKSFIFERQLKLDGLQCIRKHTAI